LVLLPGGSSMTRWEVVVVALLLLGAGEGNQMLRT
jgi:hypothetical protein